LFLSIAGLAAAELPKPYDAEGQVVFLSRFLAEFADRYRLYPVDLFERETLYRSHAPSTDLVDLRFVYRTPDLPPFESEKEIIRKYAKPSAEFEQSFMIHTLFNLPAQQLRIVPEHPVPLNGQLFRVSVWIHSKMYRHSLSLFFRNSDGREVEVPLGSLMWNGWRRVALQLPEPLFRRGRKPLNRYTHFFIGFLLKAPPNGDPEAVSILIDNLLVIADQKELDYPGNEILDTWK